jgi:hypothetical protein
VFHVKRSAARVVVVVAALFGGTAGVADAQPPTHGNSTWFAPTHGPDVVLFGLRRTGMARMFHVKRSVAWSGSGRRRDGCVARAQADHAIGCRRGWCRRIAPMWRRSGSGGRGWPRCFT